MRPNRGPWAWLLCTAVIGVGFGACDNTGNAEGAAAQTGPNDALVAQYQVLMDAHDEVMPMSADIARAEKALEESGLDTEEAAFAKTRLAAADEAMMTWMYNNETAAEVNERLGPTIAAQHLAIRKKEIDAIGDSMRVAVEYARSLLPQ